MSLLIHTLTMHNYYHKLCSISAIKYVLYPLALPAGKGWHSCAAHSVSTHSTDIRTCQSLKALSHVCTLPSKNSSALPHVTLSVTISQLEDH